MGQLQKVYRNTRGEKSEKEAEEIFEVTMAANFTKLMTDTTDRESWEHQAQYIYIYKIYT